MSVNSRILFLGSFTLLVFISEGYSWDDYDYETLIPYDPHILSASANIDVLIGESVTLPCEVDDLGDFVLLWKTGKGLILFALPLKVTRDDRLNVPRGETSLRINGVLPKDSGEYVCQISTFPPTQLTHALNVLYPPAVKSVPASGEVNAKEGENVILSCDATGNPEPRITWRHAVGRRYESGNGRDFTLNLVKAHDSGEYECIAENGIGDPVSTTFTVDVEPAPETVVPTQGRSTTIGLNFTVSGNPHPRVTWKPWNEDIVIVSNKTFGTIVAFTEGIPNVVGSASSSSCLALFFSVVPLFATCTAEFLF